MRIFLMLIVAFLAVACSKRGAVNSDSSESAPAKAGIYMSDEMMWSWLASGNAFCYDLNDTGSCIAVEYPSGIGSAEALITHLELSADSSLKIQSVQKLKRGKNGEICFRQTEAFIDSYQVFSASDLLAWVGVRDKPVSADDLKKFLADVKRTEQQTLGKETCFRYLVTRLSADGGVMEVQEHQFIDGIRQKGHSDSLIVMFGQDHAKSKLLLRPQ